MGPQRLYRFPAVKNLAFWEFSTEALGSTAGAVLGSFLGRRCMFLCFFVFFLGRGRRWEWVGELRILGWPNFSEMVFQQFFRWELKFPAVESKEWRLPKRKRNTPLETWPPTLWHFVARWVVSHFFVVLPVFLGGKDPIWLNDIFQMGWNYHLALETLDIFTRTFFRKKKTRIPCRILFWFCFSRKLSFEPMVTRILGKYHLLRYLYQRLNSQELPGTNSGNPFPS